MNINLDNPGQRQHNVETQPAKADKSPEQPCSTRYMLLKTCRRRVILSGVKLSIFVHLHFFRQPLGAREVVLKWELCDCLCFCVVYCVVFHVVYLDLGFVFFWYMGRIIGVWLFYGGLVL